MTVIELIERLRSFAPDSLVVVPGYESGFDGITSVHEVEVEMVADGEWFNGQYEGTEDKTSGQSVKAVALLSPNWRG